MPVYYVFMFHVERMLRPPFCCLSVCQWEADGPYGPNGPSVTQSVGGAGSDEHVAAPTPLPSMEEPSVKAHPSRESPAPHYVQVSMTVSSVLFLAPRSPATSHVGLPQIRMILLVD